MVEELPLPAPAPPVTKRQAKDNSSSQTRPKSCPVCKRTDSIDLYDGVFICTPCVSFARKQCRNPQIQDCISGKVGGPVGRCTVKFNK